MKMINFLFYLFKGVNDGWRRQTRKEDEAQRQDAKTWPTSREPCCGCKSALLFGSALSWDHHALYAHLSVWKSALPFSSRPWSSSVSLNIWTPRAERCIPTSWRGWTGCASPGLKEPTPSWQTRWVWGRPYRLLCSSIRCIKRCAAVLLLSNFVDCTWLKLNHCVCFSPRVTRRVPSWSAPLSPPSLTGSESLRCGPRTSTWSRTSVTKTAGLSSEKTSSRSRTTPSAVARKPLRWRSVRACTVSRRIKAIDWY